MLRLHGFASSNYHNVVKVALIEKQIEFEEVTAYPPADEAFKSKNPTGRYPCLELADGSFLGETKVILNYLEEAFPEIPLLPADPLERARVREMMEIIDLYLELQARRLYPEALFNAKVSDEVKVAARGELERGVAGLGQRASYDPYLAGSVLSFADFTAAIHLPMVSISCRAVYGEDLLAAIPGLREHQDLIKGRESMQRIKADREADVPKFTEHRLTADPIRPA